jgi:hypothetical protein
MVDFDDVPDDPALDQDPCVLRRLNVLYLVDELEWAISQGGITWTTQDAECISEKLTSVLATLRRQAGN